MSKIKCNCGKESNEFDRCGCGGRVIEQEEKSGFFRLSGTDTSAIWVCPECYTKAKEIANQLVELVGSERIWVAGIMRRIERDMEGVNNE